MTAVCNSQTALNAIAASTTALDALYAKKKRLSGASATRSGIMIILGISDQNVFEINQYGWTTLSDNSQPDWSNYKAKYAFFKQFKKYSKNIRNDTDADDWIEYFEVK